VSSSSRPDPGPCLALPASRFGHVTLGRAHRSPADRSLCDSRRVRATWRRQRASPAAAAPRFYPTTVRAKLLSEVHDPLHHHAVGETGDGVSRRHAPRRLAPRARASRSCASTRWTFALRRSARRPVRTECGREPLSTHQWPRGCLERSGGEHGMHQLPIVTRPAVRSARVDHGPARPRPMQIGFPSGARGCATDLIVEQPVQTAAPRSQPRQPSPACR
jgi:hypothetical protein